MLDHLYLEVAVASGIRSGNVRGHDQVDALTVAPPEGTESGRIEFLRAKPAFQRNRISTTGRQDEVDFIAVLAPPLMDAPRLQVSVQLIQDVVLPERPSIR